MIWTATTPTDTYTLPISTDFCDKIQLTYTQGNTQIVKLYENGTLPNGMTLDGNKVIQTLTQEETRRFRKGEVIAHLRVKKTNSKVYGSQEFKIKVEISKNEDIL